MMDATVLKHLEAQERLSRDAARRKAADARRIRTQTRVAATAVAVILVLVIVGAAQLVGCAPPSDSIGPAPVGHERSLVLNGSNGGG